MAFRVEMNARAKRDLVAIASFIQISEPALRWFEGLETMILSLEEGVQLAGEHVDAARIEALPERGTSLPTNPGYRQLVYGSSRILYRDR